MANASQTTSDLKGDLLSVKMFGAAGDGITDDRQAFQDGIDYLYSKGGGYLRVPKTDSGLYLVGDYITIKDKVILLGEGDGSLLKRGGSDVTAGYGLITIDGVDAGVQDLKIDGDVTTSVNLLYGAGTSSVLFNNDPMDSKLVLNTSIWVRPGAHNVWIAGVTITHTGGYSILLDAQDGDIRNASILDCFFENNRPHLFGVDAVTPANNIYGAWTGGIFAKGDCRSSASKLFAVRGLIVRGCYFHRMNGNCVWSHSYGFDTQHENFQLDNNVFRYIARDGYMVGNVTGGHAHGTMKYVGFTHSTDIDTPVGAYLANNYAVGFDAAGFVSNFEFSGDVDEVYGGGFDLDGVRDSTVISPKVSSSQAITKGIQTGDTSANGGGANVRIIGGHLQGCNAGSIVLNQADSCLVTGMTIDHPTGASVVPVLLYSLNKATKDCVVTGCVITYPDANFCIAESDNGTGTGFDSGTRNHVFGNVCLGANKGEFYKNANSASVTGITLSSNAAAPANRSEFFIQREGQGISAALKGYTINTSTSKQRFQWQDYRDASNEDSVLNISMDGTAGTGILATGDRSTFGFGDSLASGHLLGYGFVAVLGKGAAGSVYDDTRADSFSDIWALLRFDEATNTIQQSVSTSSGHRVWTAIGGGGGSPGGSDTYVQFNDAGAFGGESHLRYDKTNYRLGVGVTAAPGATLEVNGNSWLLSSDPSQIVCIVKGAASQAGNLQEWHNIGGTSLVAIDPAGNIFKRGYTQIYAMSAPGVSGSGQARIYVDSSTNKLMASVHGAAAVDMLSGAVPAGSDKQIQYNNSGVFGASSALTWDNGSGVLAITGSQQFDATAGAKIVLYESTSTAKHGFSIASSALRVHRAFSTDKLSLGYGYSGGYNEDLYLQSNTLYIGNVSLDGNGFVGFKQHAAPNADDTYDLGYSALSVRWRNLLLSGRAEIGDGGIRESGGNLQWSHDRSTWNTFGAGSGTPGGANTHVQYNNSGAFGGSANHTWNNTSQVLTVTGLTGTAGIVALTSFIQSAEGFYTASTDADCINAPSGGVTAKVLISVRNDGDSGLVLSRTSATAREYGLGIDSSGALILRDRSGAANRLTMNTSGTFTIGSTTVLDQSGNVTMSGVLNCNGASGGVNVSSNSAYNCIQASNSGGMAARSFTATTYIQMGQSSGTPSATTSDSLNNGCLYYDTSTSKARVRIAGSFVDIATGSAGGVTSLNSLTGALSIAAGTAISVSPSGSTVTIANTGVTSATGTSNQVNVSASTGAVTFSLPQSIHTGASPTFNALTITTTVQASNTGTGITFQNSGGSGFQVNGNGVVSCTSLNVSGVTAIDSSRNTSFAILTWSGQTRGPYTADTGLSFASSAGKIAYYDTAGNFKGWIPVLP